MALVVISVTQLKDVLISKVKFIKPIVTHIFYLYKQICKPFCRALWTLFLPKATLELTEP